MDNPIGDTVRHILGETEHERDNVQSQVHMELDALDHIVFELPGICPPCGVDVAVS